jgi:hypothetical protein
MSKYQSVKVAFPKRLRTRSLIEMAALAPLVWPSPIRFCEICGAAFLPIKTRRGRGLCSERCSFKKHGGLHRRKRALDRAVDRFVRQLGS